MIVDKLKNIAETLGFGWDYGSESWQNLNDFSNDTNEENQQVYFLLLYKDRDLKLNDFNQVEAETFSGDFILAVKSRFNQESYKEKYEDRIKQVEAKTETVLNQISDCEGLYVELWKEVEVSNAFDTNVDGLKISFRIRHES
jgi:hypothetical protein